MTGERPRRDSGGPGTTALDSGQVKAFLKANPDFLVDNPDLVAVLSPPGLDGGENVHDLQQFMLRRLRDEARELRQQQSQLIDTSRANMSIQAQVHAAALALVEARSFEHLIHVVTTELAEILNVDAVTICVEVPPERSATRVRTAGVFVLEPHGVDSRIGQGREVLLANDVPADPEVFGPASGLVKSQALARLSAGQDAPAGLLALGAREADKFQPGQGVELLSFLAGLLGRLIRGWLGQSA